DRAIMSRQDQNRNASNGRNGSRPAETPARRQRPLSPIRVRKLPLRSRPRRAQSRPSNTRFERSAPVIQETASTLLGRRMALTFPLFPPPQKNRLPLSDSSPETPVPAGISKRSSTFPVSGSMRRTSLASSCQVPCQSSPSTQVTPVKKQTK